MDDSQFRQLLQYLGLSWKGYHRVRNGVKKRISSHMYKLGCRNMSTYLDELDKKEEERKLCEQMMTVSISRFFRDRKLWEVLEEDILPGVIEEQKEEVTVWSAGCACGEEVYSLKILWERLSSFTICESKLHILATDMNPVYLQRARTGIYPLSSLKEVPLSCVPLYFREDSGSKLHEVKAPIKRNITWREHHFGSEPPSTHFQLLFLRNSLLTYYQEGFKKMAFEKMVNCLSAGGFLIIGSHEKLPLKSQNVFPYGSLSYVFKKRV